MKFVHRIFLFFIFIVCYSATTFCQIRSKNDVSNITSTWSYVHGDMDETLHHFVIPDFNEAVKVNLPHRLTLPNSVFWYQNKIKIKVESVLKLNADDGAQVWANRERLSHDYEGKFYLKASNDSTEIIIRVLNNAVAGGLRSAEIIPKNEYQNKEGEQNTNSDSNIISSPLMSLEKIIHPEKEEISFSFWGDSQGGWKTFSQFAQNMARYDDDFNIGLGDLVADGSRASEWNSLRQAIAPLYKKMPLFFILGNHDYDGYYDDLVPKYYLQHILGEKSAKTYYDFYVGKAAFIALDPNSNFPLSIDVAQQEWMTKTMQTKKWTDADWRFLLIHQVPYGQGWQGYEGDLFIRSMIDSTAETYKIDFVLSGHIHDYERLTKKYNDHKTTFIISGGAGGGIEPKESNPFPVMDRVIKQHHSGRMTLQKNKAMMYIYDINGDIIDQLTIQKSTK